MAGAPELCTSMGAAGYVRTGPAGPLADAEDGAQSK